MIYKENAMSKLNKLPCIILNRDAKIIDSVNMPESLLRSYAEGAPALNYLNRSDRERIIAFCGTAVSPVCDDLSYVKNTALFEINSEYFNFGFARKVAHYSGQITEMYLLDNKDALFDPALPFSSRLPYIAAKLASESRYIEKRLAFFEDSSDAETESSVERMLSQINGGENVFNEYLKSLYSSRKINTANEIFILTKSLITKIKSCPDIIYSKINFEENKDFCENKVRRPNAVLVNSASYVYLLTLLLSILNAASDSYKINIKINKFSDNVETILSTETSSILIILNNTADIISLSPYIPNSYFKLSLAFYIAAAQNVRLNTCFSPIENSLGFSLGFLPDDSENFDFKYRDPLENFDALFEEAVGVAKKTP